MSPHRHALPGNGLVEVSVGIERVWRSGGTFQEWSERFDLDRWLDAMHAEGLDPDWFVTRHRTREELRRKVGLVRDALRRSGAQLRWHDPAATFAEGIASRGDRRVGRVIERVWRAGGTFQEWSERFDLARWLEAMAAEGLDPDWYVTRHRTDEEILPWDHIAAGLHRDFLWADWQAALHEHGLPDCRWTPCYDCGVCTGYALEHVVASPMPPAGGSQGTGQGLDFVTIGAGS